MSNVLALDIETKNFSYEIGGWDNTHMFQVSTVCTWDGEQGTVYIDKKLDGLMDENIIVKSISELKYDLDNHYENGGKLLGHNIAAFDLPVLKNALDIYCIGKYFDTKSYIDTSQLISKEHGERYSLNNLVHHTLKSEKLMDSSDAPLAWREGKYAEVAEYCLKDCELVYDLWKYGQENKTVSGFSSNGEEIKKLEVKW